MQVNGDGIPTGTPPAGSGDPIQPANTGGQGDPAPANANPTNPPAPAAGGSGDGAGDDSVDGLKRSLAAARRDLDEKAKEARDYKRQHDAAAAKLKEREDAEKSDLDKANERAQAAEQRVQEAERRAQQTALRFEVNRAAVAHGFSDPDDAYRMIDWSAIEYDDEGVPQGVAPLVEQLAKDKPYLVKAAPPPPKAPPATPNSTRDANGRFSSDDDKARKAEMAAQVRQSF